MNHEQWEALKAATHGHTQGRLTPEGFRYVWGNYPDCALSAAAPDLLAEVGRLRAWIEHIREKTPWDITARDMCDDALNGAEVPE